MGTRGRRKKVQLATKLQVPQSHRVLTQHAHKRHAVCLNWGNMVGFPIFATIELQRLR